jgi:riboflavin synthase
LFTGIIEDVGTIDTVERRGDVLVIVVSARRAVEGLPQGGSIAVNGCCLTAVGVGGGRFTCELTQETLRRTAFAERLRAGVRVNLERPMPASGRFDGHIVQGHVDGVGTVTERQPLGESAEMTIRAPRDLERYLVEKGSVAVDGVSLTVARLLPGAFKVALIPYTLSETNLRDAGPSSRVNLEVDVIAKYVERLMAFRES